MKAILASLTTVFIFGCTDNNGVAFFPEMPDGLKDCKVYNVQSDDKSKTLHIVRCPNSSTTTTHQTDRDQSHITTYEETVRPNKLTKL